LWRKLELKRGANKLGERQRETVRVLTLCGFPPVVAWSIREAWEGLAREGFRFAANAETLCQRYEAMMEASDREAALVISGHVVRKPWGGPKTRNKKGLSWIKP
jgi:hypothetical protein